MKLRNSLIAGRHVVEEDLPYLPQRIVCGRCGFILYEGAEVKQPVEVILQYDGRCPGCGKPLEYNVNNIRLKILGQKG